MTPKRWLALLVFYASYLFLGANIYYYIEHNLEKDRRAVALQERIEINEYLVYQLNEKNNNTQNEILNKITTYCGKPVTNYTLDKYEDPYKWTFYHSFFFAFTVCSTVGYGNLAPTTALGQMIMIAYSLVGIPVSGILFAGLGEYFSIFFRNIYKRYKQYKTSNDVLYVPRQFGLFATITIALVPGITFFIIIPSCIFSYFEGWPLTLSIYYSYVTTTTIGFGDYVPTFQPHQEREFGIYFILYQIYIIFWFIFALGYVVMIMTFITKGFRSKKLQYLENQLSLNIKATQSRIWHGVTKDVGYLRRILNELVINVKPVYNEPGEKYNADIIRSASCPDLRLYRVTTPIVTRKRAFSESFDQLLNDDILPLGRITPLMRVASDTDLDKINKKKTFETISTIKETTNLLARVVTALANIEAPPLKSQQQQRDNDNNTINSTMFGAYHGFSDAEILASEWSFPYAKNPIMPYHRARASSDFFINPKTIPTNNNEWTWGGDNDQIQQVINNRNRFEKKQKENLYKASFAKQTNRGSSTILDIDPDDNAKSKTRKFSVESKAFFKRLMPFKKRGSQEMLNNKRKQSTISVPEEPQKCQPIGNSYSTITGVQSEINRKTDRRGSAFPNVNNFLNNLFSNNVDKKGSVAMPEIQLKNNKQIHNDAKIILSNGMRNIADRRGSSSTKGSDRRGSIFNRSTENRGSFMQRSVPRRPSYLPNSDRSQASISSIDRNSSMYRHSSLFSVPSQEEVDRNVLENTTVADLIRALEVLHTRATLEPISDEKDMPKKQRKLATVTPPKLPPIFTIFSQNTNEDSQPVHNSGRRATIFGSPTNQLKSTPLDFKSNWQRSSMRAKLEMPPAYSSDENNSKESISKFRRRFSVRPTELQIPLGKAPPVVQSMQPFASQTALQRRLSLRPSPLARELSKGPSGGRGSTSSTHSPLSRMAQIQAQRKNSKTENLPVSGGESNNKEQLPK